MSTVISKNVQVGTSGTATNNFTLYQPASPDGTVRLGVGNTGATTADVITATSSGNVGIGTSSTNLSGSSSALTVNTGTAGNFAALELASGGTLNFYINANSAASYIDSRGSRPMVFQTNGSERARIDSTGRALFGTTSGFDATTGATLLAYGTSSSAAFKTTGTTNTIMSFYNDSGSARVGWIGSSGTSTSFNTTSDYRLKKDVQPMANALARVAAMRPVTYKWKFDGAAVDGFIAHELAEVCPQAVTGEKDAVDAKGNPVYQGIDTSFLVATLTAAIQEQQALITSLTARIAALEAKP